MIRVSELSTFAPIDFSQRPRSIADVAHTTLSRKQVRHSVLLQDHRALALYLIGVARMEDSIMRRKMSREQWFDTVVFRLAKSLQTRAKSIHKRNLCCKVQETRTMCGWSPHLLIDSMLPHFLLCSSTVCTSTQDCLHLFHAGKQNLSRNEPSDTLMARRASQTALVGPELVEM
jgi:hypothetical protein